MRFLPRLSRKTVQTLQKLFTTRFSLRAERPKRAKRESMGQQQIQITLADTGEGPPLAVRLKRLLKIAGRVFALRCVDVRELSRESHMPPASAEHGERGD